MLFRSCSSETCPEEQEVEVTLFEQVKGCVTARQAAEHYGIKVKGNGMACCPFHKDRHPSMTAVYSVTKVAIQDTTQNLH